MTSIHERLAEARQELIVAGLSSDNAAFDAEVLARHVLGWDRAALLSHRRDRIPDHFDNAFAPLIARRARREPVAYIVGHREFWGLDFEVTHDVLIPRPETEFLIEEAKAYAEGDRRVECIIDVGTGSGCIAIALALELPHAQVIATDMSARALDVARRNAARHGVSNRVTTVETDLLAGISTVADLIVSNPPYVPSWNAGAMQPEVGLYEPPVALFSEGHDGMAIIRRLLTASLPRLAANGRLMMEFGYGQEAQLLLAAQDAGWEIERMREDLQSIPRVAVLRKSS